MTRNQVRKPKKYFWSIVRNMLLNDQKDREKRLFKQYALQCMVLFDYLSETLDPSDFDEQDQARITP